MLVSVPMPHISAVLLPAQHGRNEVLSVQAKATHQVNATSCYMDVEGMNIKR